MTKGMNRIHLAAIAGLAVALMAIMLMPSQVPSGVTLEAGGVQMTLDVADKGLQLRFSSAG